MGRRSNYADSTITESQDMDIRPEHRLYLEYNRAFTPSEGQETDGIPSKLTLYSFGGDWSWRPPIGVPNMTDTELNRRLLAKYPNGHLGISPCGSSFDWKLDSETLRTRPVVDQSDRNMTLGTTRWWTLRGYEDYQRSRREHQAHVR